jgi:hypothetical protein
VEKEALRHLDKPNKNGAAKKIAAQIAGYGGKHMSDEFEFVIRRLWIRRSSDRVPPI